MAVVPEHSGYVIAATTLNSDPVTDSAAKPLVASTVWRCVPMKYMSTIVRAGSAMLAAKAGAAIRSILLFNIWLLSADLSKSLLLDDEVVGSMLITEALYSESVCW